MTLAEDRYTIILRSSSALVSLRKLRLPEMFRQNVADSATARMLSEKFAQKTVAKQLTGPRDALTGPV